MISLLVLYSSRLYQTIMAVYFSASLSAFLSLHLARNFALLLRVNGCFFPSTRSRLTSSFALRSTVYILLTIFPPLITEQKESWRVACDGTNRLVRVDIEESGRRGCTVCVTCAIKRYTHRVARVCNITSM